MIDTKISDDKPDESIEHTEGKENKDALKSYKVTLRSTSQVEVELNAASVDEAEAKAFHWYDKGGSVGEFCGYHIGDDDHFVGEKYTLWWVVCCTDNEIRGVQVLKDDTWRPCIGDS